MDYKFKNVYLKYIIYINTKQLIGYKSIFKNKWTLWFHNQYDNNWTLDSYKKIYSVNNISSFWQLFNNYNDISNGMYFFMKNKIKPTYEDKHNKNGGYWSIKINNLCYNYQL